jgi:hypothetical protein
MNWLSQLANKAPRHSISVNTEGHKAKKSRMKQDTSGMPDDDRRNHDISIMVRGALRRPSTEGRSLDNRNRLVEPTDEQSSKQSSMMSDTLSSRSSDDTLCGQTSRESQTTK